METEAISVDNLVSECQTVADNSLYNAQAHFILADIKEANARLLLILPSAVAGLCGILTAVGLPSWLGAFSALGGFTVAVATILGVDKEPNEHRKAAAQWTALRHEARSLCETYFKELPRDQFLAEVRRIDDRYNSLCQALEVTNRKSFEAARKQIESGDHKPDRKRRE